MATWYAGVSVAKVKLHFHALFLKESFTLVLGAETVSHEAILFDVVVVVAGHT